MAPEEKRPLKVFLCHASGDKPPVRELYKHLVAEGVDAWLDQEKLLPGQDWRLEIPRAVQDADVVVVCLSNKSVTKAGYVQKEIKFALDIAEEKPEGAIFLIPARLEHCVVPERLSRWQWVDLYEENGFTRLLRSLKLRAIAVGAIIEPAPDEDTERESDRRLDQLYTEGLAAFYTEDWDKACRRFRAILSEQPSHRRATEKLEEAECQRKFARLYVQATEAYRSENWHVAISALDELSQKAPAYKDAAQLLRDARKRAQLTELYAEAQTLHAAQKWQAVVKVFEQISVIEPNYPDVDGLLVSAQKEVGEIERLAALNDQYSHALREMDSGNWYESRSLLEGVHKSQTGFMETEKLLIKVDNEILKEEEKHKQNDQINTLYEQAHGLLRSKKWRNALDKLDEIRKLDDHFSDTDGIAERARAELEQEEKETQKQNQLAAMYAEAVRLLKEEKYQEALDKWQEVKAIDSKYPDRQWVQRTAKRKLAGRVKPRTKISRRLLFGIMGITAIVALIVGIVLVNYFTDPTMYDDFENPSEGGYNKALWLPASNSNEGYASLIKKAGKLSFTVRESHQVRLVTNKQKNIPFHEPFFLEAQLFLDPATTSEFTHLLMSMQGKNEATGDLFDAICGVFGSKTSNKQDIECWSGFGNRENPLHNIRNIPAKWHTIRIEVYPPTTVKYIVDGTLMDEYMISQPHQFNNFLFEFQIGMNMEGSSATGYFDNVRFGPIEDDPARK